MTTWTVLGVWLDDQAVSVGVIEGNHNVHGGNDSAFGDGSGALVEDGGGLWATSVEAPDAETAESLAVEEMESTLGSDSDESTPDVLDSDGTYTEDDRGAWHKIS